jgi:hypothetical protein
MCHSIFDLSIIHECLIYFRTLFFLVTSSATVTQSSSKQKSGRGRKKIAGKRQAEQVTDSVISSKAASSTTPSTQNFNNAAGVCGAQSLLDSTMRGKPQELIKEYNFNYLCFKSKCYT